VIRVQFPTVLDFHSDHFVHISSVGPHSFASSDDGLFVRGCMLLTSCAEIKNTCSTSIHLAT
jgi:hypothetical protein